MKSNCQSQDQFLQEENVTDQHNEIEKMRNLLKTQIRLLQESNQEVENLKKKNCIMKMAITNLEELKSKATFENEQLHKNIVDFDQYLETKEKLKKATELIAELWIENKQLKEIIQKK